MASSIFDKLTCGPKDYGKDLSTELIEDHFYLEMFCRLTGSRLINFGFVNENPPSVEMVYYFNDGLGGYTIKGIYNTLRSYL